MSIDRAAQYAVLGFVDRKFDCAENHKLQFVHSRLLIMSRANQMILDLPVDWSKLSIMVKIREIWKQ